MFKKINRYLFLFILLVFQQSVIHAQEHWKLVKETNGIKVYTASNKSDFKSFKGHIVLDDSIHAFVALISDVEGFTNWGYKLKQVSVLEKTSDTLQIYHAITKVPFPYKNREGVYRNTLHWNSDLQTLYVSIEILDDYKEEDPNYVRVSGKGFWRVLVLSTGKLDVTFQMQVNPGGKIPAWIANMFITKTPYYTLLNIRKTIKNSKYQYKKFSFIK